MTDANQRTWILSLVFALAGAASGGVGVGVAYGKMSARLDAIEFRIAAIEGRLDDGAGIPKLHKQHNDGL